MKIALLDKDGTLVVSTDPSGFVTTPEQQVINEGSLELVSRLLELNYTLIVVSNQGGVEYKYKTLQAAIDEMFYCNKLFWKALNRPVFNAFYFCPDFKGESCWKCEPWTGATTYNRDSWRFGAADLKGSIAERQAKTAGKYRKPECGMLKLALEEATFEEEIEEVIMIGDRSEDLNAAKAARVKFAYIGDALSWLNKKNPK